MNPKKKIIFLLCASYTFTLYNVKLISPLSHFFEKKFTYLQLSVLHLSHLVKITF